jgi:hypothetical protein
MIRASNWRPLERNTLQGFVTLHLEPSGLTIHECTYHRSASCSDWVGLPARPQLGKDGQQRKDPANGKPLYQPIVEIRGKKQRERFQTAALAAVRTLLDTTGKAT